MTPQQLTAEQERIINEHHGVVITVDGVDGAVVIRPLPMEALFDPKVIAELAALSKTVFALLPDNPADALKLTPEQLLQFVQEAAPMLKHCLERCVDRPLLKIDTPFAPRLIEEFVNQNFTGPRLKPWVDLLRKYRPKSLTARRSGATISATPSRSSWTTGTPGGEATPATSSSSGSGGP